ncbi:MAG: hypothetical protein FWD28_09715 [Treponema sp.]|nr:hypothetical protein [Treponema sp.]
MFKRTGLFLLFVFIIGIVSTFANIQPGSFHQMGNTGRMEFTGTATRGNVALYEGNTLIASGTYQVNGDRLVVHFRGHGTDEFLIVSRTELRDSINTWRRM